MSNPNENLTTKDIIFHAAVELFSQKGYHGTSIRDITRKVGIKESSLYNHYQGKEAILQAILDFQMDVFNKAVEELDKLKVSDVDKITDPVEFWMAGTDVFLKTMPPLSEPISRILINEMFLNPQCRRFYLNIMLKSQRELVKALFSSMREKGMIGECDIDKTACQYVCMVQGLEIENTLRAMEGENPDTIQKNLFEHITLFIRGMERSKK